MQKDLKIGLACGLILVGSVILWLSTRPSLSTQARMLNQTAVSIQPSVVKTADVLPQQNNLSIPSTETTTMEPEPQAIRFHIVQKGDTLSKISSIYYGTSNNWQKILDANRDTMKNANKLTLGAKIIIPR
ncbi:MAG: LysM peptidoglycan-binding domain-containing protein [Planctomycetes bacterium]|nr:LysM peptidoglycan-binding domain-containing protein [Planctomycetota bacterium]